MAASREGRTMAENHKHRATGRTDVTSYVPAVFDEPADGPALVEVHLVETFTGDIEGELTNLRGDGGFTAQIGQHGSIWLDYSLE